MKKLILYTAFLFCSLSLNSNPIELPYILINELYFEDGEWTLELAYFEVNQEYFPITEILISSSSGEVEVLEFEITGQEGLILVENNYNLSAPLFINSDSDIITLTWGIDDGGGILYQDFEMSFGDQPNSSVAKPHPGQSIANIQHKYTKDKSPTIGFFNDTIGTMGSLEGTVFDMFLQPVAEETFCFLFFPHCYFTTSENGDFSVRVLSNIFDRSEIYHKIDPTSYEWLPAEIHYTMEPDSVVNFDIYLLDSLTVGISNPTGLYKGIFRFYPNPVSNKLSINYELRLPGHFYDLMVEIKSLSSMQVFTVPVSQGNGIIQLPEQIPSGIYIVNLLSGQNVLSSGRLVVSR